MLGQESLFNKMTIAIFLRKKMDLVEEIPFFPTASAEESNDSNDGSSYQCPEPGCVDWAFQLLKFSMSQEVKKGPFAALTFESSKILF